MANEVIANDNVIVLNVRFAAYETLLAETGDSAGARFAYDGRVLEFMSPSADHEYYNVCSKVSLLCLGLRGESILRAQAPQH